MRARVALPFALALLACEKVPLLPANAGFTLSDATWFAEEQTLFVFYRLESERSLGSSSQLELTYTTDTEEVRWTPLTAFQPVHPHVPVTCGENNRCGSLSLKVTLPPRNVGLRLRYHPDGEMALGSALELHVLGKGPAHTHRSLIVYGVFDEKNAQVQWRARHQFPALRNEEAQELGLRRAFRVAGPRVGDVPAAPDNPYTYAFAGSCPESLASLGHAAVETSERSVFSLDALPLSASAAPAVCGLSTVTDALGTFDAPAVARKNPEVRAAFPRLHSPIQRQVPVGYLLRQCRREPVAVHRDMQVQRLMLEGQPELCVDDWEEPDFPARTASTFRARIDQTRAQGKDMLLVLALHHDDTTQGLAKALEKALELTLAPETEKGSPRVSGAFVFDTVAHTLSSQALKPQVLWCPANLLGALDSIPDTAQRSCPLLPDVPDAKLGPFRFSAVPILASQAQYLSFIGRYSAAQAGRMVDLAFLAPERTPLSQDLRFGEFGAITFFNNERLTPAPTDAFSFCPQEQMLPVVFRAAPVPLPMPLLELPSRHAQAPAPEYELGIFWEFPFLTRLRYEVAAAGAVSAFNFSVPFGFGQQSSETYGASVWESPDLQLSEALTQCTRFCTHPTFDSAGVYGISAPFNATYGQVCYRPDYPKPPVGGFPRDP